MRHPRVRSRLRSLGLAAAGAAVLLAFGACLNDPAGAPTMARLAVRTNIHGSIHFQVAQQPVLFVDVGYYRITEEFVTLRSAQFPLDTTGAAHPLDVDISSCLRDSLRASSGGQGSAFLYSAPAFQASSGAATCPVLVRVAIVIPGLDIPPVDQQTLGPYDLRLGETVTSEPAQLFTGTNAPVLSIPGKVAVAVDDSLLRIPVSAHDVDRNLSGIDFYAHDSTYSYYTYFSLNLAQPVDTLGGALYGFVPAPTANAYLPRVEATARDTKYAYGADTAQIALPAANAPIASNVTAVRSGGTATIGFDVTDREGDVSNVEVLFRDPAAPSYDSALLLPVCERTVASGNGTKSVSCPAPALAGARVIVIPFDATRNVGRAARGTLP